MEIRFIKITALSVALSSIFFFTGCSQGDTEIIYKGTYKIEYNANGGSGSMANQSVLEGKKAKLSTNTFTRKDYIFAGWLESASQDTDESGKAKYTLYSDGQEIEVNSNITLYAQWKDCLKREIKKENSKEVNIKYAEMIKNSIGRDLYKTKINLYFQTITDTAGNEKLISDMPFVSMNDLVDYFEPSLFYNSKPELSIEGNVYTFTRCGEKVQFNFNTNKLILSDIDTFNKSENKICGLDLADDTTTLNRYIIRVKNESAYVSPVPVTIDFNKYEIPLLSDSEGNRYIPLQTYADLLFYNIGGFAYNGKDLYITPGIDSDTDLIVDFRTESTLLGNPSEELVKFNYNEICMNFDCFYGLKEEHKISDFKSYISTLKMKDGTAMVDSFLSTEPLKPAQALHNLIRAYLDDLHSGFIRENPYCAYSDTNKTADNSNDGYSANLSRELENKIKRIRLTSFEGLDDDTLDQTNPDDSPALYEDNVDDEGNIIDDEGNVIADGIVMILTFDEFSDDIHDNYYSMTATDRFTKLKKLVNDGDASTIELVLYAHAKLQQYVANGKTVKAIIIDDSLNTGGEADAVIFINAWIKGAKEQFCVNDTFSKSHGIFSYEINANFDDEPGIKDSILDVSPNTKIYCLTSGVSFSCGNILPASIKGMKNVTIIGQKSGGGTCAVKPRASALGDIYQMSSQYKFSQVKNGSKYSVDQGVEPDVYVSDFANIYDRANLVKLIKNLN